MKKIKLTVIVPVYNVERYLERCLNSIVTELLRFNRSELILIDDGSTDKSPEICDLYSEKYSFIKVIHQVNKGLSAVRNIGISKAEGEYISFIDSDDYIQEGLYTHSFKQIEKDSVDIYCFQCTHLFEGGDRNSIENIDIENEVIKKYSTEQALKLIFYNNYIDVITCNKIIRKECFEKVCYPEGKLYEDMFTTYKIIANAKSVLTSNLPFYVYCHRSGSIGTMAYNTNTLDLYRAAKETYDFTTDLYGENATLKVGFLYWKIVVANIMIRAEYNDREYMFSVRSDARKLSMDIIKNQFLSNTRKIQLILFGFCPAFYKIVYLKYLKNNR